jgi:FKBP-type peptidyl-prolyl cis-trans isomerase
MKQMLAAVTAIFLLASCNVNYEKTESGLIYKIFPRDSKDTAYAKPGEFVKFHITYLLSAKDSVLNTSFGHVPNYGPVDTSKRSEYTHVELLTKMRAGDSAVLIISVDTLVNRGMVNGYNDEIFIKGSTIKCYIKVLQIFKSETDLIADYQKELDKDKEAEIKVVEAYMAKNNLKGIRTKNGAFVVIESMGDTTLRADSGMQASIKYKGYRMNDGFVFDTNMDTSKGKSEPFPVIVGSRSVIQGWEEGLPYFGKGGKGKILVPSALGYGPQARGADIPSYTNLVFDIEVTDVQKAPKQPEGSAGFPEGMMPQE